MTGQIASPSIFSLEMVGLIIGVSMIVGAVDLLRQPGWAWKRAEESKAAYLILVLFLPLVGLGMYVFSARPKVVALSSAGRAASLPFERFGEEADRKQREAQRDDGWPIGTIAPPVGFGSFGATTVADGEVRLVEAPVTRESEPAELASTFFSTAGTATRTSRSPVGLARSYRPRQRTSLPAAQPAAVATAAAGGVAVTDPSTPTVPAGWKADPTGRHQFRYWDGFQWTENVADAGAQSRDAVSA
jgi:hypothetical protein